MPLNGVNVPKLALWNLSGSPSMSLPSVEPTPREVSGGLDTSLASASDTDLGWLMGAGSIAATISPRAVPKLMRLKSTGTPGGTAAEQTPCTLSSDLDTSMASAGDSELGCLASSNNGSDPTCPNHIDTVGRDELRGRQAEAEECSLSSGTALSLDSVRDVDSELQLTPPSQSVDPVSRLEPLEVRWNENAVRSSPRSSGDPDATTPVAVWHDGHWTVFSLGPRAFKQLAEGDSESVASPAPSNFSAIEAFDQDLENASAEETDWLAFGQINNENILATPRRTLTALRRSDSLAHSPLRPAEAGGQTQTHRTEAEPPVEPASVETRPAVSCQLQLSSSESSRCDSVRPMEPVESLSRGPGMEAEALGTSGGAMLAPITLARSRNESEVQLMVELTECPDDEGDWLTSGENTPMSVVDTSQLRPPRVSVGGDSEEHWVPSGESPRSPLLTSNQPIAHPGPGEGTSRSSRLHISVLKPVAAGPHSLSLRAGNEQSPMSTGFDASPSLSSNMDSSSIWTPDSHGLSVQVAEASHQLAVTPSPSCSGSFVSPSGRISPNPRGTAFLRLDQQRQPPSKIPEPSESHRCPGHPSQKLPEKFLQQYHLTPSRIPQPEYSM